MTFTKFSILYVALSLFASLRPNTLSTSTLQLLPVANAIALPEPPKSYARRDWDSAPCTDTDASTETAILSNEILPTASIAEDGNSTQLTPVTVTITIITAANTTFTLPPSTTTSTASHSNTTSTAAPSTQSVNPLLASAQEAQRLNAEWANLKVNDACTPGERACVDSALAQCSSDSKWVRSICVVGSDPNVANVCAAIPTNSNSTSSSSLASSFQSTTSTAIAGTLTESNDTPSVQLGCFPPNQISQLFTAAGVEGGMFPPGFQTSDAEGKTYGRIGMGGVSLVGGALIALLVL